MLIGPAGAVALGDVNGDGKADLVAVNNVDDTVSVLLGNGDGSFQPARQIPSLHYPLDVAVGDFDGDGKLDLLLAGNAGDTGRWMRGHGDGTLDPDSADPPLGHSPKRVWALPLSGRMDAAIVSTNGGTEIVVAKCQ